MNNTDFKRKLTLDLLCPSKEEFDLVIDQIHNLLLDHEVDLMYDLYEGEEPSTDSASSANNVTKKPWFL